jgi:hypothetical protein
MKRSLALAALLVVAVAPALAAHDLFLKLTSYFVTPGQEPVRVPVLNGTFARSENSVARDRVRDATLVGPGGADRLGADGWSASGDTSYLTFRVRQAGTHVVGASTLPRTIALSGKEFNEYLKEDGIADVLEARTRRGELGKPARERYAKHVKAIFQAGESRTSSYGAVLGYPAEIVPLANPYEMHAGDSLAVRCLVDGKPIANQVVIAGWERRADSAQSAASAQSTASAQAIAQQLVRTDADGVARVRLAEPGKWFIKFVHMAPLVGEPTLDYESKWATLTFEVR